MNETFTFAATDVHPAKDAVFQNQGLFPGDPASVATEKLYDEAVPLLQGLVVPVGILQEISSDDFARVYRGQGWNEPRTPVGDIYPRADVLALFVVSLGDAVSREIKSRFAAKDFALAAMLDAAASVAADVAAQRIEDRFGELLLQSERAGPNTGIVRYSPGYCGWDITGQEKLFEYLSPDQIGVSLNESNLMEPLKSVSGVVIAGPKEIHDYPMSYPSCGHCDTRGCRARIRAVLAD